MRFLRGGARRAALISVLAGALGLLNVLRAEAQLDLLPKIRLKAGVFLPQNTALNNAVGDVWFKVGGDVSVPLSLIPLFSTRIGVEGAFKDSSTVIPVTLMQVWQPSAVVARSPVYAGGGIGLWTARVSGSPTATRFGFRLLGGADIGERLFLEAHYDFVDRIGRTRADGFSILLGVKF